MRGAILLSVLAALLVAACAATAAPPRPQVLDRSPDVGGYSLAGNAAGDRLVVLPRDLSPDPAGADVFSAPPAAPFGPPSQIRGPGVPDASAGAAVGPGGSAAIAGVPFRLRAGDPNRVTALVRDPGGSFTGPVAISGEGANDPHVAFDAQGNAVAVWARDGTKGIESYIEESTRPLGGEWSAPDVIARQRRSSDFPEVAFDATGGAVIVWTREGVDRVGRHPYIPGQVMAAVRPAGGAFGPARVVSQPHLNAGDPAFSMNAGGRAAVVWVSNTSGDKHFRVGAAFRSPGRNRFGKPRFLTRARDDGAGPSVALDSRGRGVITWVVNGKHSPGMDGFRVRVAFRSRSGRVSRPHTISGPRAEFPELAANARGRGIVAWVYHGLRGDVVQARRITAAGRIGRLTPLSSRGGFDRLHAVIDDAGAATLAWTDYRHRLKTVTLRGSGSRPSGHGRTSRTRPGGR